MQANAVHEEWIKKFIICNMRAFYCLFCGDELEFSVVLWWFDRNSRGNHLQYTPDCLHWSGLNIMNHLFISEGERDHMTTHLDHNRRIFGRWISPKSTHFEIIMNQLLVKNNWMIVTVSDLHAIPFSTIYWTFFSFIISYVSFEHRRFIAYLLDHLTKKPVISVHIISKHFSFYIHHKW